MLKRLIFNFLIIVFAGSCETTSNDLKDKENSGKKNTVENLTVSKIPVEYTDSLQIDSFLLANKEFEPYRKKLYKFYSRRDYKLAWSDNGKFLPQASMFVNALRNAEREGLESDNYKASELTSLVKSSDGRKKNKPERIDADLKLSASYFKYSKELWKGRINPSDENISWFITRKKIKFGKTLDSILDSESSNPFKKYMPVHDEYHRLLTTLDEYRKIEKEGGWPKISLNNKKIVEKGDTAAVVIDLKKRLSITGDLAKMSSDSIFSEEVEAGIKKFQKRHGLEPDGVLGPSTIKALNIPVSEKIKQILVNMERWRWVPEKIGDNYLIVNIPEFKLRIYEKGKETWDMKVIVGKTMNNTPVFNDRLEYIVLNPYWNVPKSIATEEIVPLQQKNPNYLASQNMTVYQGDPDKPLNPAHLDWNSFSPSNFPYQIRQNPGGGNALGRVKFLFPNNFSVYLHDTPTKHLFSNAERDFSHGCIRVEKPLELAEYILRNNESWTPSKIKNTIGKDNQWIKLSEEEQIPVYILYFTVWVDKNGEVQFRDDIYGHDKDLTGLLFQ